MECWCEVVSHRGTRQSDHDTRQTGVQLSAAGHANSCLRCSMHTARAGCMRQHGASFSAVATSATNSQPRWSCVARLMPQHTCLLFWQLAWCKYTEWVC